MKNKWIITLALVSLYSMAQATVIVNVNEVYNEGTSKTDIVWDWSGSLNITGATQVDFFGGFAAYVNPYYADVRLYGAPQNTYAYSISGPSFGALGDGNAYNGFTTKVGNTSFAVAGYGTQVYLAQFYSSESAIYGTNVMANKTISSIGLNGGSYTWTMAGSGDKITMNVIPEPASALLIGCGAALIAVVRRFYGRA